MRIFGLALFLSLCASGAARAQIDQQGTSTGFLADMCKAASADSRAICIGFLMGHSQTRLYYEALASSPRVYCPPPGTTFSQLLLVFGTWAERNPRRREQPAVVSVVVALREAFPCGR